MAKENKSPSEKTRSRLAYGTLIFSVAAITALAVVGVLMEKKNTMQIFHVVVPLFATWVGTILAFYFGRENFESANQEVRKLVAQLNPEERAKVLVTSTMKRWDDVEHYQIPKGKEDKDVELSTLIAKFKNNVSRLPILDGDGKLKYVVHEASINKYKVEGGSPTDKLDKFISEQKKRKSEFGLNKGFVLVSEKATLVEAKSKMDELPSCQDVFITKGGTFG